MGRMITNLQHNKNKILLATYIMRCLPILYIQNIGKTKLEKQQLRNTIVLLQRNNFISLRRALHGLSFLTLTKDGYDYINSKVLLGEGKELYQHEASRVMRKNISEHSYMNFLSIWYLLTNKPELLNKSLRMYDDSNINKCKINVFHLGKDFIISPDVMVLIQSQHSLFSDAIFIENDTGRETYKTLYHKFVEYAVLIEKGMHVNKLNSIKLYFITKSNKRLQSLFSDTGLVRFFSSYNTSHQLTDVRDRLLVKAFANPKFSLQISSLAADHSYEFTEFSLQESLLRRNPTWKNYL